MTLPVLRFHIDKGLYVPNNILCLYSGGLDSTALLYHLLTEKQYQPFGIHAHFIININREGRHLAEIDAINRAREWFKNNCRYFRYTENTFELNVLPLGSCMDGCLTSFVSSQIIAASDMLYPYVAIGIVKDDTLDGKLAVLLEQTDAIFAAGLMRSGKTPKKIFPLANTTKLEIWDYLPEGLRKCTWSCRHPKREGDAWVACRKCPTCRHNQSIIDGQLLANAPTAEVA